MGKEIAKRRAERRRGSQKKGNLMSKASAKRSAYMEEILRLKKRRRMDVAKCAIALVLIAALLLAKQALAMSGYNVVGNMAFGTVEMVATIALAILGGTASIDFTKSGNQINALKNAGGISDKHLEEYASSR